MNEAADLKRPRKQPITRHPVFPVAVALWLAALLGLGTLAASPTPVESIAPFGDHSRFAIAIAMAGLGGLFGIAIARLVTRSAAKPRAETTEPSNEKENLDAAQDYAPEPLANEIAGADDRHANEPDGGPSIDHTAEPDLPAQGAPKILNVHEIRFKGLAPDTFADAQEEADATMPVDSLEWNDARHMGKRGTSAAERIANADLNDLSSLELLERLALGLNARRDTAESTLRRASNEQAEAFGNGPKDEAPAKAGSVRSDERQQPGPSHDPKETDEALRAALATLQRLSAAS